MMIETVVFREKHLGISRKRVGLSVGNLIVVPDYRKNNGIYFIYSQVSLSKFFKVRISGKDFAIKIAKFLDNLYGEYLLLSHEIPDADVIALARYSVPGGLIIENIHNSEIILTEDLWTHLMTS